MATFTSAGASPRTLVLIHGLWLTPLCWERWVARYERLGYRVLAPAWPGMDVGVDALRAAPSRIAHLGVKEIVDHYDAIIRSLDEPPILIGHSFGGAFVQLLLDRGLGAAGVALESAGVRGVLPLPLSTLRATWPVLRSPANRQRAVPLTAEEFHYAFTNTLSEQESRAVWLRYAVPGPGRVLFQGAFANFDRRSPLRLNPLKPNRAPLLLIAGGADHVTPPKVNRANVGIYRHSRAVTAYREFAGRPHLTMYPAGWEEVADVALAWAIEQIEAVPPAPLGVLPRPGIEPPRPQA